MVVILVTGMSGVGKSAALGRLGASGYSVVDTDVGQWIEHVAVDGDGLEPLWRADRLDALLTDHERSGEPLFIAGTVRNQGRFYARFDHIVLLSAPLPVMLERIRTRTTNPFGKTEAERAQIIADTAEVEPLLRDTATLEIDAGRPLRDVVERLAALAGPPPAPRARD